LKIKIMILLEAVPEYIELENVLIKNYLTLSRIFKTSAIKKLQTHLIKIEKIINYSLTAKEIFILAWERLKETRRALNKHPEIKRKIKTELSNSYTPKVKQKRTVHPNSIKNLVPAKKKWNTQPTKTTRIPAIFEEQILAYAQELDKNHRAISQPGQVKDTKTLPMGNSPVVIDDKCNLLKMLTAVKDKLNKKNHHLLQAICQQKQITYFTAITILELINRYYSNKELPTRQELKDNYPEFKWAKNDNYQVKYGLGSNPDGYISLKFPYQEYSFREYIKQEFDAKWHSTRKRWLIKEKETSRLLDNLKHSMSEVVSIQLSNLFKLEDKIIIMAAINKDKEDLDAASKQANIVKLDKLNIDSGAINLRNYQKDGVRWLLQHTEYGIAKGGILAYDMGLGKTYTSLSAYKTLTQIDNNLDCLIICPASVKNVWGKESQAIGVPITTYSYATKLETLEFTKPYILILDEAHYIQNHKSQRTTRCLNIANHILCKGVWLLTGTPLANGQHRNLLPLLNAIAHPLGDDINNYLRDYCFNGIIKTSTKTIADYSGSINAEKLFRSIKDSYLRVERDDVLKELPPQQRIIINCEPSSKEVRPYKDGLREKIREIRESDDINKKHSETLTTIGLARQLGSQVKAGTTLTLVRDLINQNESVVIMTDFLASIDIMEKEIKKYTTVKCITGDVSLSQRTEIVERFQSGEIKVLLATIKTAGTGLTLTKAKYIIMHDRTWRPGDNDQAEARIRRMGQIYPTTSYWISWGIDCEIDSLLMEKKENIQNIIKTEIEKKPGLLNL
jgi:SNF2 family DNA or RNA helicase